MNALTPTEQNDLSRCEKTIERGMATFVEVGKALLEVREGRYYRRDHETFADYCQERWGFTHGRARQLIAAAKTQSDTDVSLPNEAVARELKKAPEEDREKVLAWAEEKSDGKPVTAATIRKAVKDYAEQEPDEEEDEDEEPVAYEADSEEADSEEEDEEEEETREPETGETAEWQKIRRSIEAYAKKRGGSIVSALLENLATELRDKK